MFEERIIGFIYDVIDDDRRSRKYTILLASDTPEGADAKVKAIVDEYPEFNMYGYSVLGTKEEVAEDLKDVLD